MLARDNEVTLTVANPLSTLDIPRSFINHALIRDLWRNLSSASLLLVNLTTVRFNPPSIDALNVGSDGYSRDVRESFMIFANSFSNVLRRLIIEEVIFNCFSELWMDGYAIGSGVAVPPVNPGHVLGVGSIIESALSCFTTQFLRDSSLGYAKPLGDLLLSPALADKFVYFISIIFV